MTRILNTETGEVTGHIDDGIDADAAETDLQSPFDGAADLGGGGGGLVPAADRSALAELLTVRAMPVIAWAKALLVNAEFGDEAETDPSMPIIAAILAAKTPEQAMAVADMTPVETLCPKEPGSHSPVLRITAATPLKSSFEDGPPVFCVVTATVLATGEEIRTSIGARAVQAVILKFIHEGWMPFDAILTRRLKPTRAGFYPMNLEAGG